MGMNLIQFTEKKREEYLKKDIYNGKKNKFRKLLLKLDLENEVELFEMYLYKNEALKGRKTHWQYDKETRFANTRTKLKTETRAEIDKLPLEKALSVSWRIIKELIRRDYHFVVFYAEGGRSPHIILYDFEELKELDEYKREIAQREFWKSIAPFDYHSLDQSIWQSDHYVPLEFAPHWKHGNVFDLCFEWIPKRDKKCKN